MTFMPAILRPAICMSFPTLVWGWGRLAGHHHAGHDGAVPVDYLDYGLGLVAGARHHSRHRDGSHLQDLYVCATVAAVLVPPSPKVQLYEAIVPSESLDPVPLKYGAAVTPNEQA